MKKSPWEEADEQLVKKLTKKHPHLTFRVLRGGLHAPLLQKRGIDGDWSVVDVTKYL